LLPKGGQEDSCRNAPAAVACLRIARFVPADRAKQYVAEAQEIVDWTRHTLEADDGLYCDRVFVESGKVNTGKLTYNTALMIRAYLGLFRATGDETYLQQAKRVGAACDGFLDQKTGAYRDPPKWSHLLVEADLELFRATNDDKMLARATRNADYEYAQWKAHPPDELIENAAVARTLWLMSDMQTEAGREFWRRADERSE